MFGGNTLDGFVLDQNQYPFNNAPFTLALASAAQFGQSTVNYAFNQPVTAASLPANASDPRQSLSEIGFLGGIMSHTTNPTSGSPYALSGVSAVLSTADNNRLAALFSGFDPFTPSQSGINSLLLSFGSINPNSNASRGTYINNTVYAATDSPDIPSMINGNALALPPNSTSANPSPSLAMVTSGTVPNAINSILPAGVSPCTCQYLQWGYWTGQVQSTPTQGLGVNRTDRAFINTWVAGMPTVTMPTVGMGTYSGAAIGTVSNAGGTYLAAGGFNNTYNFANNTGAVAINNFDGHNFSGNVSGSGPIYAGTIAGAGDNRQGSVIGSFYGPGAAETGGNFAVQATSGPSYIASGIFAGKLTGPIH